MKVEIWSDVMCPFCYIGKRKFEKALCQFAHKDQIEVEWKSFLLNPRMKTEPDKSINQYLAEAKGWSLDYAKQMNEHVTSMAKEVGLHYDFDKVVVANAFDAHRLIQLAKAHHKGDIIEERLFKAYFTEGKNIADHNILIELAGEIGLNTHEVKQMLESKTYSEEVTKDIYESQQIGVKGVPFFVLNRQYAVSGAQPDEVFLDALNKAWEEWLKHNPDAKLSSYDGAICKPDDNCDTGS